MYAIDITSTAQTAAPGDKITSTWVNAVNTASVSASTSGIPSFTSCSVLSAQNSNLVFTTCKYIPALAFNQAG
jgi:hypothetical protein